MSEQMNDNQIKHMVDRFLGWKLPENFNPDGGISFTKTTNEDRPSWPQKNEPTGTNLFDADQAEEMVRYMVAEVSPEPGAAPTSEAQTPAVSERDYSEQAERDAEKLADGYYSPHRFGDRSAWYAACVTACREIAALRGQLVQAKHGWDSAIADLKAAADICRGSEDELVQLRARVAIFDAQEVELPDIPTKQREMSWAEYWRDVAFPERSHQLLDALRAVQAWREASSTYRIEHRRAAENNFRRDCGCRRCKGYDALAGKGE